MSTLRGSNCGLVQCGCPAHTHTPTYPWPCRWESLIEGKHQLLDQRLLWKCIMNCIQHTVMNLLHLLLLLLLLLCLLRHFLLYSKTDRETDRETDLSVKKKKTKANPRTIRTRLCLSFCACQKQCLKDTQKPNNKGSLSVCLFVCVPARNNTCPKERQNPTRISFLAEKCLKEDKNKTNKNMSARQKMFARRKKTKKITQNKKTSARKKKGARRRKTKPRRRRRLPKKCFLQEERQKNQWQEAEHKFAKGGYSTVELYLYAADSELVKTNSLVSLLQLLETRRWRRFIFQGTIWRWVCALSRYLLLSQFKKSLGCAAPRRILVTETEEKLAAYDPRLIYWRESRACM